MNSLNPTLILGSSSVYRQELLQRLRLPFEIAKPVVDETPHAGESAAVLACRLAKAKAEKLIAQVTAAHPAALIIGADQAVDLHGQILGKPGNYSSALKQLQSMRGHTMIFHTALCVLDTRTQTTQLLDVPTTVKMRHLDDASLAAYLHAEPAYDCAGSAKVEGLGITLLESCESSDPTALIGLPLIALCQMLNNLGYPILGPSNVYSR